MKTLVRFGTIAGLTLTMGTVCFGQHYTQTNLVSNTPGVAPLTDPQLINPWGISRGSGSPWWISDNRTGFGTLYDGAGVKQSLIVTIPPADFPGPTLNQLLGLNNLEQAAGYYADAAGIDHPYIFDNKGGVFSVITIPAAVGGAQATGINDNGSISGFYIDGAGKNHGFLISKGEFKILDFPGATLTQAFGLNNRDEVVGQYVDASRLTHGFTFNVGR